MYKYWVECRLVACMGASQLNDGQAGTVDTAVMNCKRRALNLRDHGGSESRTTFMPVGGYFFFLIVINHIMIKE